MSQINQYFSIVALTAGVPTGYGSRDRVVGSTTGDGSNAPAIEKYSVAAGDTVKLYDYARASQRFTVMAVKPSGEGQLWVQGGMPAEGDPSPTSLTWNAVPTVPGFVTTLGSSIPTNLSVVAHADDAGGFPSGASDATETTGLVYAVVWKNTSAAAQTVEVARFN